MRQTSVDAYNTIKENGLLSAKRWRVYSILFNNGPLIGSEVARIYFQLYGKTAASETIRNRLTELRNSGVVTEMGKALDRNTGMTVILWEVTKNLPINFEKPKVEKCKFCKGTGFIKTQQARMDV